MTEYISTAKNFLKSCNAKMSITFKRYGKHFEDDKDFRNIYTVRIDRDGKSFSFQFGDKKRITKIYRAVAKEFDKVTRIFGDVMDELQKIY